MGRMVDRVYLYTGHLPRLERSKVVMVVEEEVEWSGNQQERPRKSSGVYEVCPDFRVWRMYEVGMSDGRVQEAQ